MYWGYYAPFLIVNCNKVTSMRQRLYQVTSLKVSLKAKRIKIGIGVSVFTILSLLVNNMFFNLGESSSMLAAGNNIAEISTGNSIVFDGSVSDVYCPYTQLDLTNKLTVSVWVKWDTIPQSGNIQASLVAMNSANNADNGQFWLQHNSDNSKFEFAVATTNGISYVQSESAVQQGKWYHLSGIYNSNKIYLYVNGILESQKNLTGQIVPYQSDFILTLGEWAYSGDNYRKFKGEIDEVTIWNKALNTNQVRTLMCESPDPGTNKLSAYFDFNSFNDSTLLNLVTGAVEGFQTGTSIKKSGAPVGSKSSYEYDLNQNSVVSLEFPAGGILRVTNIYPVPEGIQLYYTDAGSSELSDAILPLWGVLTIADEDISFNVTYYLPDSVNAAYMSNIKLYSRPCNDTTGWTENQSVYDQNQLSIGFCSYVNNRQLIIGRESSELPVEFGGLYASILPGNNVRLSWITFTEINNDFFNVQWSLDGIQYTDLAVISGAGNSNSLHNYDYTDRETKTGINYYRIKQTDFDGKNSFSQAISVNIPNREVLGLITDLKVFPNPFHQELSFQINGQSEKRGQLLIYDVQGVIHYSEQVEIKEGNWNRSIADLSMPNGTYFFELSTEDQSFTKKIIKQ